MVPGEATTTWPSVGDPTGLRLGTYCTLEEARRDERRIEGIEETVRFGGCLAHLFPSSLERVFIFIV